MDYKLKTIFVLATIFGQTLAVAQEKPLPPNTIQIAENLYADQTEMSNLDWKEYVYWHKHVFGEGSAEHLAALPDTTVWNQIGSYGEPLIEKYYSHPAYEKYPVVGITQQQATYYCRWRSNRYFEMLLVKEGVIEFNKKQSAKNYFSIERFFAGEFELKKENLSPTHYPLFTLPDADQFNLMQAHNIAISANSKNKLPEFGFVHHVISPSPALPEKKHRIKNYLYYLDTNVAEWGAEPGVIYSGSFSDIIQEEVATDEIEAPLASPHTGFRCACQWVEVK